jgi:hypothetical protein
MVMMIAGCTTSTSHQTSTNHNTSTNHRNPPVPDVTGVTPPIGTTAGGTTVTITGTGFVGTTKVTFGAVAATSFMVISDTEITAVSPAQPASIQNVHVTTAGGTSEPVVAVDPFTYVNPVSAVTGIAPSSGAIAGGTKVAITGTGFTGATKVVFGTVPATKYTVVSDTEIIAISPAHAASVQDIQVTTAGGTTTPKVAHDEFTYAKPAVTGIAPSSGAIAGGATVTITGTAFTGATEVAFGAVPATKYTVVSDTEIIAISPAHAVGICNIMVVVTGMTSSPVVAVDRFTYKA